MKLHFKNDYKSLKAIDIPALELPELAILSGPNGSGKSHLLQAVNHGAAYFDDPQQFDNTQIKLFEIGDLGRTATVSTFTGASVRAPWSTVANTVEDLKKAYSQGANSMSDSALDELISENIVASKSMSSEGLKELVEKSGKRLIELEISDFETFFPLLSGAREIFSASIAELFLAYATKLYRNRMKQWLERDNLQKKALTNSAFEELYGSPPWELLDKSLEILRLPYSFVPPPEDTDDYQYEPHMRRSPDGAVIRVSDLSSGERVILALSMALYAGSNEGRVFQPPRVLLLDEADASLHPSMIQGLLTVLLEVFVEQFGIQVILATHSPTTIALAPETSLYKMEAALPRIQKSSRDESLTALSAGIPTLSVRVENRRQVFVESEVDQEIHQLIWTAVSKDYGREFSIEFVSAGKSGRGGGCDAVKRLVSDLRTSGVDSVFGLIDRDQRQGVPPHIAMVNDRYSLENIVFDPLILSTFLLREMICSPELLGLSSGKRHFALNGGETQAMVDALGAMMGVPKGFSESFYAGGFSLQIATHFLETQGHVLESEVLGRFPELKRFKSELKQEVVRKVLNDRPDYLPQSVLDAYDQVARLTP